MTTREAPLDEQLDALRGGRARADLSAWWKLEVTGPDARRWLDDIVTADLSGLGSGQAVPSLLLSPTGRIRAAFTVADLGGRLLLVQDPIQPTSAERLLRPYVLSSDVHLTDRTSDLSLVAFPGGAPDVDGWLRYAPSALGTGEDLAGAGDAGAPTDAPSSSGDVDVSAEALERWRIERGIARFGIDIGQTSLPNEGSLDEAVAYGKGCFLGQEAVARVRNLGHPPNVIAAFDSPTVVRVGETVLADGEAVGVVSSAAPENGGTRLIARVRWSARGRPLATGSGARLAALDGGEG
jgi:tRNA-modifying protein YgfZ